MKHIPKVLIAITLLAQWSTQLPAKRFDMLDLFAGAANASKFWLPVYMQIKHSC